MSDECKDKDLGATYKAKKKGDLFSSSALLLFLAWLHWAVEFPEIQIRYSVRLQY